MKASRISWSVPAVLALLLLSDGPARGAAAPPAAPVSADYFCMHVHSKPGYEAAFTAPFRYLRTWDSSIGWPLIEPENGVWNWELLDRYVDLARANGEQIILTLGMTPLWAAIDPHAPSPYGSCSGSPPRDIEDWRDFIRHVAQRNETRYQGAIRHWEIWNEPDNFVGGYEFYSGTIEQLLAMARIAHDELKAANPDNRILSPGITQAGAAWLDRYLAAGGRDITDIVAFHFYWDWYTPAVRDFRNIIQAVQAVAAKNGLADKPLWLTETGIGLVYYKDPSARAMAMVPLLAAPRFYGADLACAYAWNNKLFTGLFDVDKQQTTETHAAYLAITAWLAGARVTDLRQGARTGAVLLERNGRAGRILWRTGAHASRARVTADPDWGDVVQQAGGPAVPAPADRVIILDAMPVLVAEHGFLDPAQP